MGAFVIFGFFAFVQYNDTDPAVYHEPSVRDAWMWLLFYVFISALCLLGAFRRVPKPALVVAAILCLALMAMTGPGLYENLFKQEEFTLTGSQMAPTRSHIELSREFLGVTIALAAVGLLWWQRRLPLRS